jgi:GT2 family glycosyltransferase
MKGEVEISVVVGLISGDRSALGRCLEALEAQTVRSSMEIIVPYDPPVAEVAELQEQFPGVSFIGLDGLDTSAARAGGSREHHDALRTAGIRAGKAEVIALTEDHAHTESRWAEALLAMLRRHPKAGAVGGPVDCDSDRVLGWAVWFCDFGRYQSPLREGCSEFVSDSNVAYRRAALDRVETAWRCDYHETVVHSAMIEAGFELRIAPGAVVWQARRGLTLEGALRERFVWARSFAGTRARLVAPPRRWMYAVCSPLLPLVMTWRLWKVTTERREQRGRFIRSLPAILALQVFWAIGECMGYVTADPGGVKGDGEAGRNR